MKKMLRAICIAVVVLAAGVTFAGAGPVLVEVVGGTPHQALMAVAFDQSAGVAVGAGGQIMTTQDAGKTWQPEAAPLPLGLLGVAIRQGLSVAVGQGGLVLVRDGANAWKKVDSGSSERFFAASINAKGDVVVVGSFGAVIMSSDHGRTWKSIAPQWLQFSDAQQGDGFQPHIYDAKLDDSGVITIAGELGIILRSADGGQKWSLLHKGDSVTRKETASLFALEMRPDGVAFAVGQDGMILKSTDRGSTWSVQPSGTQAILLGVSSSSAGGVIVTGMHDMLYSKDDGATWAHVSDKSIGSSWFVGIARPNSGSVVVVGNSGKIMRIDG